MRRTVRGALICVLPVLTGLWIGAIEFGGRRLPWTPNMVDLEVYREAGRVLLAGGDFYALPGRLQFLYPPFAAVPPLIGATFAVSRSSPRSASSSR